MSPDAGRPAALYVVGGRQRQARQMLDLGDWYGYGLAVIAEVDGDRRSRIVREYTSAPGTCAPGDPILFKSGCRRGDTLYCCTQTEVLAFTVPTFEQTLRISLPWFNDVHHVFSTSGGTLLIANSGLDSVLELDLEGTVLNEWNVLGAETWATFDKSVDYRMGVDLKPHRSHPNHVFEADGKYWATRFEQRDAVALDFSRRIDIGEERVHDGVVHGGLVYFTTVNGWVVAADPAVGAVVEKWKLRPTDPDREVLGWCRGLHFDGDSCWVGFSRIRATRLRATVSWVRTRQPAAAPTRIVRYSLPGWQPVEEIELESVGVNAVFSILPATP
jgi:hypothetical protein